MAFDVEGALKAGYTQEEINQFLSQQPQEKPNFDVEGALKAGYTQEESRSVFSYTATTYSTSTTCSHQNLLLHSLNLYEF
jgi:alkylhydroperoxidase/carboxymuconolactone decarboxylase family protein YurZ